MSKRIIVLSEVSLGADPEFFIKDSISETFKSGLDYPFGSKGEGLQICEDCKVENDNVTIEMVLPPVPLESGLDTMWENYMTVKSLIEKKLPEGFALSATTSAQFPKEVLEHPAAIQAGCEMDYNAWMDGEPNDKPELQDFRCCGGHIHIGVSKLHPDVAMALVKLYDLFVTTPLVLLDGDKERRKLYGTAGSFRMEHFKVECRSTSNVMWRSKDILSWVFSQVSKLIAYYNENDMEEVDAQMSDIINCINNSDVELAKTLVKRMNLVAPPGVAVSQPA